MFQKSEVHNLYVGRRDSFYYLEVSDKSQNRDNRISEIFNECKSKFYWSPANSTDKIFRAKFWKDQSSAKHFINSRPTNNYFILKEISREQFIESIPDKSKVDEEFWLDQYYLKNLDLKEKELKYSESWKEFRKNYKCISAYKKVTDPLNWLPCRNCGLIPLVWEFNNGRSTACGCGENEYRHHSIRAESIMSHVTRNNKSALNYNSDELRENWNHWVKTGQDKFEILKKEKDIW